MTTVEITNSFNVNRHINSRPSGIVLLVTLVVLVVLSVLSYTLGSRVAAYCHRNRYIINYSTARYGCDSAVKYAMATIEQIPPELISRPNEPDFSDLFTMSQADYEQFLQQWVNTKRLYRQRPSDSNDSNRPKTNIFNKTAVDANEPNSPAVRGPYGPEWPFVTQPVEFKIGEAAVRIEIEDENAKYPLGWAILADESKREALTGLKVFCEWMGMDDNQIDSLKSQLQQIGEIKPFKIDLEPVTKTEKVITENRPGSRRPIQTRTKTATTTIPATVHITNFARLFHSSLFDADTLAVPIAASGDRKESVLKYIGLWGSRQVNINTAPRHVLEAAFTFGGDAAKIAGEIIQRRQIKPFSSIEELKKALFEYSASIDKCKKYITTTSDFFTIRVTATTGLAKVSTVIAVMKNANRLGKIAAISG